MQVCRIRNDREVMSELRQLSPAAAERAASGEWFNLSESGGLLRELYRRLQARHRGKCRWIDDHSPLVDVIDGAGLKYVERGTGAYLSRSGGGQGTTGGTPAIAHRWLQEELASLGVELAQTVSGPEDPINGGMIDVSWDEFAWEVDRTKQSGTVQQTREEIREDAGFKMVSLTDPDNAKPDSSQWVRRVVVRGLNANSEAAATGSRHRRLGDQWVGNVDVYVDGRWRWRKKLKFRKFCVALTEGRLKYEPSRGRWVRREDERKAAEDERKAAEDERKAAEGQRVCAVALEPPALLASSAANPLPTCTTGVEGEPEQGAATVNEARENPGGIPPCESRAAGAGPSHEPAAVSGQKATAEDGSPEEELGIRPRTTEAPSPGMADRLSSMSDAREPVGADSPSEQGPDEHAREG